MKQIILLLLLTGILSTGSFAQNERKFIRRGNSYYLIGKLDTTKLDTVNFNKAEIEYRKALEKKPDDQKWNYNLGNSLYKQKKFEESSGIFRSIASQAKDTLEKSKSLHNLGNALMMSQKLDESIDAYKEALRINPNDLETKYNLLYAMNLKKQEEEKQKNQDKNQDKNKDQDKKDQENKDQQNKQQDQNQDKKEEPQQTKISKQNAEQMLQALENNEKKTQEKVKKMQALKAKSKNVEKDW